jgi:DNA polymerase
LRAEKAFGVSSVVVSSGESPVVVSGEERSVVVKPTSSPQPVEQPLAPVPARSPLDVEELPAKEKAIRLQQLDANEVKGCTRCRLHESRTQTVFGEGDPNASIFFIGEGPGENEDLTGRPFVGRAGQLLDNMIAGMGLRRDQVYIANIVKCRPPGNRVPAIDEVETCTPYLVRQLEIIRPKVIVTLGRPAAMYMLDTKLSMGRLRGEWQNWRGIRLMPTFHPSYVLRSYTHEVRDAVWSDLKKVLVELEMPIPKKSSGT